MAHVVVRILHPEPPPDAGPLQVLLADARRANAARLATGFESVGAADVETIAGPVEDTPFGRRLRRILDDAGRGRGGRMWGLVVLGSGAVPRATRADLAAFVAAAGEERRRALANNRYSADIVAIARADRLPPTPDLVADNALPRWLAERAGWQVDDLRSRRRLAIDLDSPLDLELIHRGSIPGDLGTHVRTRRARIAAVMADPHAELVVSGRTSAATVRWLERSAAARVRALIEERGLRAAEVSQVVPGETSGPDQRRPRSILGMVLAQEGPDALGRILTELGDAAILDSRVLLADRCGPDERSWPADKDRFASDLLLAERIEDPWLRALTMAARDAPIPVLLGGHTLVGPGLPLLASSRRLRPTEPADR